MSKGGAVLDEANKTATVLKIKPTKEVVIPKIIDGYSIVQIGICWNEYDYYFNEENEYHFTDSEYAEFKNSRHVFSTDSRSEGTRLNSSHSGQSRMPSSA